MIFVVTFEGNNKMGVSGKGLIIVINELSVVHINAFALVVKVAILSFANVDHHLVGPEPACNFFKLRICPNDERIKICVRVSTGSVVSKHASKERSAEMKIVDIA